MAVGVNLSRQRSDLATSLHASLERKLRNVENERIVGQWIDFDSRGNLLIGHKPNTLFECIVEMLARLFTSKYQRIDREIRILTAEVNDYFIHEDNRDRQARFQNQFSRPIFEICRCAEKLAGRGKIGADIPAVVIRAKGALQRMVIPDIHADSPQHRFHGLLSFGNEMGDADVRFGFAGNGESELTGLHFLHHEELRPSDMRHYDVKSSGAKLTVFADLIKTHDLIISRNAQITLEKNGSYSPSTPSMSDQQGLSFHNTANHSITISEIQFGRGGSPNRLAQDVSLTILPNTTQAIRIKPLEGEEIVTFSFKTSCRKEIPLQIGCKLARYFIKIDAYGDLAAQITPLMIDPNRDRPDAGEPFMAALVALRPGRMWELSNVADPCLLMTLRASNGKEESIFVGQDTTVNKSYDQLRAHFGVDWDGRFTTIPHYPKPVLGR